MTELPLVVSLGDPAGVGPELIAAAWAAREAELLPPFVVAGGASVLAASAEARGLSVPVREVFHPAEALDLFGLVLPVLAGADGDYTPGAPDRAGAELALAAKVSPEALAPVFPMNLIEQEVSSQRWMLLGVPFSAL